MESSTKDIRVEMATELEERARRRERHACEECGELLPKSMRRPFCVAHSPYVQGIVHELIRRERAPRQAPARRVA